MRLLDDLGSRLATESSLFRRHLLSEDVERVRRLEGLLAGASDAEAFVTAGRAIAWGASAARNPELEPALGEFLRALHALASAPGDEAEARVTATWAALERERLERFTGCLAARPGF
jgi:hypothetical protein